MSIKVKMDMKGWDKLYSQLDDLAEYEAEAGYYGEDIHGDSGLPMSNLAWIHNEGAELGNGISIPARPFMDQAFYSMSSSISWDDSVKAVLFHDKKTKSELSTVSMWMAEEITNSIKYGDFVGNSKYTISIKGADDPLINTEEMKDTPKRKVVKKETM